MSQSAIHKTIEAQRLARAELKKAVAAFFSRMPFNAFNVSVLVKSGVLHKTPTMAEAQARLSHIDSCLSKGGTARDASAPPRKKQRRRPPRANLRV